MKICGTLIIHGENFTFFRVRSVVQGLYYYQMEAQMGTHTSGGPTCHSYVLEYVSNISYMMQFLLKLACAYKIFAAICKKMLLFKN